jgi:hypothetical protein
MCVKPPDVGPNAGIPVYQEFILKPEEFNYWEAQWWNRVEQYYKYN